MTAETQHSEQLLAIRDVANKLKISARQVSILHARDKLPMPVTIGARLRWRASELDEWLSNGCPSRGACQDYD